jgi:hypothetical protein
LGKKLQKIQEQKYWNKKYKKREQILQHKIIKTKYNKKVIKKELI